METGRDRSLLVVDDEPDVETLFRQQFRREVREGLYTLDFALSAVAALAILDGASGEKIILLVSDINMPGMSGLDLLPIVKHVGPDLPVFMISAYGDADTVATALARGADEFLTKPVDFPSEPVSECTRNSREITLSSVQHPAKAGRVRLFPSDAYGKTVLALQTIEASEQSRLLQVLEQFAGISRCYLESAEFSATF